MTREEAIQVLKNTAWLGANEDREATEEAIDMAIEALTHDIHTETHGVCSDLISRDDAVKTVIRKCSPICAWQVGTQQYPDCVAAEINSLPSAEAEWIPCSERLPSDSGNYLITVADFRLGHIGEHTVTIADFYAKGKKWNSVVDVFAWMPLPKPYREGDEV